MRILFPAVAALMTTTSTLALAQTPPLAPILTTPESKDVQSHAKAQVARITHVDLAIGEDRRRMNG